MTEGECEGGATWTTDPGCADRARMSELEPEHTAALFRPLHDELMALLGELRAGDWDRPTLARDWSVRDVAAHLWDGDLRRLSMHRDRHSPPEPASTIGDYRDLVANLNILNHDWIVAARRLSPNVLISNLEASGRQLAEFVEKLDPFAEAIFPVAWAGEESSPNWMDIGREFTEKWHHQQQIRAAVGAELLLDARWTGPLFRLSVRAIPRALALLRPPEGTTVVLEIAGEGGGVWCAIRETKRWTLCAGTPAQWSARISMTDDVAWRLFYNSANESSRAAIRIEGDVELARALLAARSVMV